MADAVSIEATRIGMSMSCRNLGRLAAAALSAVAHNYEVHYHPHRSGVRMSERATDVCGRAHLHVRTRMCMHACARVCACVYVHVRACMCMSSKHSTRALDGAWATMHAHTLGTDTNVHAYMHMLTQARMHINTHTSVHALTVYMSSLGFDEMIQER